MKLFFKIIIFLLPIFSYAQYTGATPWENCFGKNAECELYVKDGYYVGCSSIKVNTSASSPVVVIVKRYGKVLKHVYISANSSHSIDIPDGTYQVFFYYGKQWDRYKKINSDECYSITGGFSSDEYVGKDDPITLESQIMTYTLTQVTYGNFNQKSSSLSEAL